jgi:hypothetical protein
MQGAPEASSIPLRGEVLVFHAFAIRAQHSTKNIPETDGGSSCTPPEGQGDEILRCSVYLDDWLIMHQQHLMLMRHWRCMSRLFKKLNPLINNEKSEINPTKELVYRGFLWNSQTMCRSLPKLKLKQLRNGAQAAIAKPQMAIRGLCSVEGKLQAAAPEVFCTQGRCRDIQRFKKVCLQLFNRNYTAVITLDQLCLTQLQLLLLLLLQDLFITP